MRQKMGRTKNHRKWLIVYATYEYDGSGEGSSEEGFSKTLCFLKIYRWEKMKVIRIKSMLN
jgi:hypothetical protein